MCKHTQCMLQHIILKVLFVFSHDFHIIVLNVCDVIITDSLCETEKLSSTSTEQEPRDSVTVNTGNRHYPTNHKTRLNFLQRIYH